MNKFTLCAGLTIILATTAYAEGSDNRMNGNFAQTKPIANTQTVQDLILIASNPNSETQAPATSKTQTPATPGVTTPTTPGIQTPTTPGLKTPNTPGITPSTAPGVQTSVTPQRAALAKPLNCNYRIPAETTHIEETIVKKWAEKAAAQSFDFDYNLLDKQLSVLKACYTDQGWQGFNDALQKSGNLNAIKSQQLMVSSMVIGESKIMETKDNQWKVTLPLQVVYQNDKEKLTQPLIVNLVVGRKVSGDLGIMQMIAIPHQNTTPSTGTTTPSSTTSEPHP